MNNTTIPRAQSGTRFIQGTTRAEGPRPESERLATFLPADSATETRSDALLLEFLTGFEREGSPQDRLAGYQSESQGE
jgi:hypothetical protein